MTISQQIHKIDKRIEELRTTWIQAKPGYRKFIEKNVAILKQKRADLEKQTDS